MRERDEELYAAVGRKFMERHALHPAQFAGELDEAADAVLREARLEPDGATHQQNGDPIRRSRKGRLVANLTMPCVVRG